MHMKNTNKPQWLIDAENEIQKFEESKYGKMSQKEFQRKEQAKLAASFGSKSQLEKGIHNFQLLTPEKRSENSKLTTHWKKSEFQKEMSDRAHSTGYFQTEQFKNIASKSAKKLDVEWVCDYCGKKGKGLGNFKRYYHHTGECKTKKPIVKSHILKLQNLQKLFELLPETFTRVYVTDFCKLNGFSERLSWDLTKNKDLVELIHKGTNGSPTDLNIYKKRETLL